MASDLRTNVSQKNILGVTGLGVVLVAIAFVLGVAVGKQGAALRHAAQAVGVAPALRRYIVELVAATRAAEEVALGASPRASIQLVEGARALAFLRGRGHATPQDMVDLVPDVLRHRILVTFEAEARGIDSDEIIRVLLSSVTVP
mgnify:CR=1 FL=1